MKITLINTSDAGGGAPAACMRLLKALKASHINTKLLVQKKQKSNSDVYCAEQGLWGKVKALCRKLAERLPFIIFNADSRFVRFSFSTAETGTNIAANPVVKEADILHLHWINQGFLSINSLKKLIRSGKPVVWTLHDMWAFTGGCHYAGNCNHFQQQCGYCWMLRDPDARDLSNKGWVKKMHLMSDPKSIVFITCSNWLADMARKSSLLQDYRIETIPNPIDTDIYRPVADKVGLRKKWGISPAAKIILFGAANIMDRRKGITYLVKALHELKTMTDENDIVEIIIFGKNKSFDVTTLPFKVHEMDIISNEQHLVELYNIADVYVTPAIEDNLPNTVMEALACGTPVVAFNTGGLPDMIDHLQNGYLAQFKSPVDFAAGINFVFNNMHSPILADNARNKVMNNFANEVVARQYISLYQSVLHNESV